MSDKAAFAIKLLFALAVIAWLCSVATAQADGLTVMSVQARGGLNVRSAPTTEATVVYVLEDTETVILLDWRGGWALVAKNNGARHPLGWVFAEYLK